MPMYFNPSGSWLPTIDEGDGGKHLAVKQNEGGVEWVDPPTELPAPAEGDANKVLAVKDDESGYELKALPIELPAITEGDAGKLLAVNEGETGVEFKDPPAELPAIQEGDESKVLAVKSDGSGVEYVDLPADELPAIQEGDAGKVLQVKSDESGVEFASLPEPEAELPTPTEGDAGKVLTVKADETGYELAAVPETADELPAIQAGDANKVLAVKSDETGVEFVTPSAGGESKTTEDIEFYVNPATGSDENDGLSAATPFATIAHALSLVPKIINHYVLITLAAGTYTENVYIEGFKTEITGNHYDYKGMLEIYGRDAVFTSDAMTGWNCSAREVWRANSPYNQNPSVAFFVSNCDLDILIGGYSSGKMVFNMAEAYDTYGAAALFIANCRKPVWVARTSFIGATGKKVGGVWAQDSLVSVTDCNFDYCNAFYVRGDGSNADVIVGESTEANVSEVVCRLLATNHGKVTIGAVSDPYTLDDSKDLMTFGGKVIHHNEEKPLKKDVALYVYKPANTDEHGMDWDSEDYPFPSIQAALDSLPKRIDSVVTLNVNDGARTESAIFEGFHGAGQIKVFVYDDGASSIVPGTAPKVVQLTPSTSVKATLAFVGNKIPIEVKGYNSTYKLSVQPYAEAGSAAIVAVNNDGLIRLEALTLAPASGSEDISSGILAMNSSVYIAGSVVNQMAEVAKVLAGARVELNTLTGTSNVKLYDCAANGHLSLDASTIANCAITGSNTVAVDSASVTWLELIRAFGPRIWPGETDPGASAKAGDFWINSTTVKIRNEANSDWITIS